MTTATNKRRQSSSYSDELFRYEFVDYTSVSNFEKFITTIEETLYSWGIKDGSYGIFSTDHLLNRHTTGRLTAQEMTRRETLVMGQEAFQLTYHCHPHLSAPQQDFPLAADYCYQFGTTYHPLHRWTGQDKLLILTPNNDGLKSKIFNAAAIGGSEAKQLISACAIAFQNVNCRVPVFVPVGQIRHEMYIGYMLNMEQEDALNETEVRFNMSLTTPPTQLSYLDGLRTLFLQKLGVHHEDYGKTLDENDVWISAVYTYHLKNWFDETWKTWDDQMTVIKPTRRSFSDDFESWGEDDDDITTTTEQQEQQHQLHFGSFNDPLRTLTLSAIFPLCQDLGDDADALTAKQWQISREFAPVTQQRGYLSTLLEQVMGAWIKDPTNKEYLAPFDVSNDDSTNDSIMMRNLFVPVEQQDQVNFFKSDQVDHVLHLLFHHSPTKQAVAAVESKEKGGPLTTSNLALRLKTGSSVPYQSFLWNLLLYSLEEASSTTERKNKLNFIGFLKIIWIEVLRKLRWHWEHLIPIPDLNPYDNVNSQALGIDLRYNILHQKISMVNCCIHRRLLNAAQNKNPKRPTLDNQQSTASLLEVVNDNVNKDNIEEDVSSSSEESDVFLDAIEVASEAIIPTKTMGESFVSLHVQPITIDSNAITDPSVAEGQSHPHPSLRLLKTDTPLNIPITQDPGFMTEDMISERASHFETLGSSHDATQKRAKLQSEQLFSDMQAFKAANPFAIFEDFVRWHSPKDFEGGQLSKRMEEGNIWQELWKNAQRVPSSKQRPLFDVMVEAEKALYYLETSTPNEFFSIMLPTLGLICYDTLSSHPIVKYSHHVSNGLNGLGHELMDFPWEELRHGKRTFDQIISLIRYQESLMCHAISLLRKLPGQFNLVDQLLNHDASIVQEGDERASVFQLFKNDQEGIISKPSFREYVLYSDGKELTSHGRVLPTRQYAIVKDNEVRILDMQTTDALYS